MRGLDGDSGDGPNPGETSTEEAASSAASPASRRNPLTVVEALDLELEQEFAAPVAPRWVHFSQQLVVKKWPPEALASLPVYARSVPTWYGAQYSGGIRWRTPVLLHETGARWLTGQYLLTGQIVWEIASYGGKEVQPENASPAGLEDFSFAPKKD